MGLQTTAYALVASDPEAKEYKPDRWMWKARLKVPKQITKNGESFTVHDWLNAVAFGNVVDVLRDVQQNDGLIVGGEVRLEKWQGRDGNERASLSLNIKTALKINGGDNPKVVPEPSRDTPDDDIPF